MMKTITVAGSMLFPGILFAQSVYVDYSGAYSILSIYSVFSVIVVGVIRSVIVLINAKRMSGGIFGDAMNYFGLGMFIMLAGITVSFGVVFFSKQSAGVIGNMFYIIGYVLMAIAANKIRNITQGK